MSVGESAPGEAVVAGGARFPESAPRPPGTLSLQGLLPSVWQQERAGGREHARVCVSVSIHLFP